MKIIKNTTIKYIAHRLVEVSKLYNCYDRRILKQLLLGDLELLDLIRDDYLEHDIDYSLPRLQKILYYKVDSILSRIRLNCPFPVDEEDVEYIKTHLNIEKRKHTPLSPYNTRLSTSEVEFILNWVKNNIKDPNKESIQSIFNKIKPVLDKNLKTYVCASTLRRLLISNGYRGIKVNPTIKARNYIMYNYRKFNKNIFFVEALTKEIDMTYCPSTLLHRMDIESYKKQGIYIYSAYLYVDDDKTYYNYKEINLDILLQRYVILREKFDELTPAQISYILARSYFYHNPDVKERFYDRNNLASRIKYHAYKIEEQ